MSHENQVKVDPEAKGRSHEDAFRQSERAWLDHAFRYHPATGDQPQRYQAIRDAGRHLASVIAENTSFHSIDRAAAITKVREAVMLANAAVALEATT